MLKALDSNGQEILAYNKSIEELNIIRQHPHYCPECQQKVVLKAGQVVIPHFAHVKRIQCSHQGESQTHLEGKIKLYHWCLKQGLYAKLEHVISSIDQRVDVLVKVGEQWVALEYQCSPISTNELLNRTLGLASREVYPLWIFGPSYLDKHKYDLYWNATLRSAVMYLQKTNQHQLFFLDPTTSQVTIATHLFNAKGKAAASLKHIPLNTLTWRTLFKPVPLKRAFIQQKWLKEKRIFRMGPTRFLSKYDEPFMKQLYLLSLHPQNLPSCVYLPVQNSYRFLLPDYIWQTQIVLYLNQTQIGHIILFEHLLSLVKSYFSHSVTTIYPGRSIHPLAEYLNLLCQLGYLKKLSVSKYERIKDFTFHQTLDQALEEDKQIMDKLFKFL